MYKSPIEIIYKDLENKVEGDILRVVSSYDINVDKVELIRALQYDRGQYEKGYADAMRYALEEIQSISQLVKDILKTMEQSGHFSSLLHPNERL